MINWKGETGVGIYVGDYGSNGQQWEGINNADNHVPSVALGQLAATTHQTSPMSLVKLCFQLLTNQYYSYVTVAECRYFLRISTFETSPEKIKK